VPGHRGVEFGFVLFRVVVNTWRAQGMKRANLRRGTTLYGYGKVLIRKSRTWIPDVQCNDADVSS
jgi:hypothetical protein